MLSSRRAHDGREEQLSQKQFPTKDHQPHRYNRSSFPCSTPSYNSLAPTLSTMASSSSSEFTSYSNFPSSPDSTGNCSESDDTSRESALLLYQAFVADESASCNSRSKQSTEYSRQGNNGKVVQDPSNNGGGEQSQLPSNDGASKKSNSLSKEANDLGSSGGIGYGSSNNENNKQHSTIPNREGLHQNKDNSNDDDASANSKSSEPSHHSQTDITSFISRHRRKIGSLMFTLTSLWMYSKFKQKNHRDRRHQLQCGSICNHDLIQRKILSIYKVLLQLLSRLRVSSLIQRMASPRITEASASGASLVHASTTPLSHLLAVAKAGNVSKVMLRGSVISYLHSIQSAAPVSSAQTKLQRWSTTTLPSKNENFVQEILSTLMNNGCDDITTLPESLWQRFLNGPALVIFPFTYLGALYWIMRRLQKQQLENEGNENKFNRTASMQHTTTFDDVAGIDSALQELSEVVAYMRNPDTFHSVGASPPRGILLWGPPGSGKTLLARAIAGEAGRRTIGGAGPLGQGATIDYFTVCSGSDFVETYVGRGAARIRSLFRGVREEAWKSFERRRRDYKRQTSVNSTMWDGMHSLLTGSTNASDLEYCNRQRPMAIIFIDEIDALAKNRDSGGFSSSLGGCDEREQTLNQLLTEMDGFATGTATQQAVPDGPSSVIVIVIAATNRLSALDPAILRAGRFDRHVQVPLPDAKGREAILRIHARRIKCDHTSVNFHELAAGKIETVAPTHNFSGADLKNVINEAALLAVRTGSPCVKQEHLLDAVQKVKNVSKHSRKESHWFER